MESNETVKQIEAPKRKSRSWLVILLFVLALAAMCAAGAILKADRAAGEAGLPADGSAEAEPTETAPAGAAPTETVPTEAVPTEAAPETSPEPTAQVFAKTEIVVGGRVEAVVSSSQAAEELLRNVQEHFELLGEVPDNALTELITKVELRAADEGAEVMSYDEAFEYFTSERTPLVFRSTASRVEDTVIPHRDTVIVDSFLPKGIRVARVVGRDGIERTVFTEVYINGVRQDTVTEETYTVIDRINGDIRIGGRVFPDDYVLSPGFGSDPTAAHSLRFVPPAHGEVVTLYGPNGEGFHHGIDISVPAYSDVCAASMGTVVTVMERGAYGLMVEVEHEYGITTRYARLTDVCVAIGDTVVAGQLIGKIAPDDHGPHLHFELRVQGTAYNPLKILSRSDIKG
ncbi:MAG: peptidoglycan DD-metalloendopeptidase family protein [Clostridia bacterium]|nr:peptidoglycan DD-metalloendopeptidase family protein [Clostridia bacterium]